MTVTGNVTIQQNIEHVENYYDYRGNKTQNTELPQELSTEKAIDLLTKLQKEGYLDDNFQKATHLSWAIASIIANEVCQVLGMPGNWKPFELLWQHTGLRNNYDGALNTNKQAIDIARQIHQIITD